MPSEIVSEAEVSSRTAGRLIALAAATIAGCQSYATQTRLTATGGAYTLFAETAGGVAESVRQALAGMAQGCGGAYEIVSLELLPESSELFKATPQHFYLDLNGDVTLGPFRTGLGYECRMPRSTMLNERVQRVAATAQPPQVARPENAMAACQTDSECDPGLMCYENRCRR